MSGTTPYGSGPPEYVGAGEAPAPTAGPERRRRWSVVGGATAAVLVAVGLGGWGAYYLLAGGGSQPAEVIPSGAVGYVGVDLDPSAAQKIEAMQILRKFPALEGQLDRDDLRRMVFEQMQQDGICEDLDYGADVEPWIGNRIGVAAMPARAQDQQPDFLVALQVTDAEAAERGFQALAKCAEASGELGFVVSGDYLLVAPSTAAAEKYAEQAGESSLAEDAHFQEWTGKVGDPGLVTLYAAAEAAELMQGGLPGVTPEAAGQQVAADFEGFAGVLRANDGAFEVQFATKGAPTGMIPVGSGGETEIADLPASTGIAFSTAFEDGWLRSYLESMSSYLGTDEDVDDLLAEMEADSGLSLPEDIETLFGDAATIALDASFDYGGFEDFSGVTQVPVAVRVKGDPDEILAVFEKARSALGPDADQVVVEQDEHHVVFALNPDYARTLLEGGDLGDQEALQKVVPRMDEAASVLFVNFDAGDGWVENLAKLVDEDDQEVLQNIRPLDALGLSSRVESDGIQQGLLRVSTD